ncbi:G patch domain-containing protein 3 isoform X2 [Protopterus annectens]|uniref:G patch domain-containing protein 3 isoform X2 n=1 Tax=Protopterus annectens TaxID=7888 RepID=UPI001CFABE86|nr:G patch domain-containing protein 3 isoform X2 [Protopterus annectens]
MAAPTITGEVYCVVSNIPSCFHSADLRNYFSQFTENGGFVCFHYRHRPEVLRPVGADKPECKQVTNQQGTTQGRKPEEGNHTFGKHTCCCVVAVRSEKVDQLMKIYHGSRWVDPDGVWLPTRCVIRKIKVSSQKDSDVFPYKTKKELRSRKTQDDIFTQVDLKRLPELNPPLLMPNGNVGTPSNVFLELIQSCRLPPRFIKKLGLKFPKTGSSRRYGNVPFKYPNAETVEQEESVFTATGEEISGRERLKLQEVKEACKSNDEEYLDEAAEEEEEDLSHSDEDNDTCEEWERHEALHDDVTNQERTEERLYEEEIELKWEKGGPGLVFYTDAQYWKEEGGDFDEQTADDWDVDMSVYYDEDGGDKDARDYVQMRLEQRRREGLDDGSMCCQQIGKFERHTKGIGRKVMEQQGWKEGLGLGSSSSGMADALDVDGQNPRCKRGLGYHGEKLQTFVTAKKPRRDIVISTIYDQPEEIDKEDQLLRRQPPTSMKYRKEVAFVHAPKNKALKQSTEAQQSAEHTHLL